MAAKTTTTAPAVKNAAIVDAAPAVNAADTKDAITAAAEAQQRARAAADGEVKTPAEIAADKPGAVVDPAAATEFVQPSGAIVEPEAVAAVDVAHEAIDANPRAHTTALQNAMDLNDAKRANPQDVEFAGQGIDLSVYGDRTPASAPAKADDAAAADAAKTVKTAAKG